MPVRSRGKLLAIVTTLVGLCVVCAGCHSSPLCQSCCTPCCDGVASSEHGLPTTSSSLTWRSSTARSLARSMPGESPAPANPDPGIARVNHTCKPCSRPTAMVLRPVPLGAPLPPTNQAGRNETNVPGTAPVVLTQGDASTWAPVQRVSNEQPPLADSNITPAAQFPNFASAPSSSAATIERPQAIFPATSLVAAADEPLRPVPAYISANSKGDNGSNGKSNDRNGGERTLPMPSETGGNGKDTKNGKETRNGKDPRNGRGAEDDKDFFPSLPPPIVTRPTEAPREFTKRALSAYIIEPPDVLQIEGSRDIVDPAQPITGPHLVRPDGTVGLGSYGAVFVAGCTIDQAKMKVIEKILERQPKAKLQDLWEGLKVDVAAYNSKFYYVITDGGGYGETVVRVPITGNETVLDAISQIQGLPVVASKKKIWVARATPHDHLHPNILPVDWCGITQRGNAGTNYQLFPGDRVYVNSQKLIRVDSALAKIISPIERLFGITLLGATTVNAIKGNQGGGGSGNSNQ